MIWLFNQILFDVIVLDWRNLIAEFLHLLWDYIYCCYMMVLNFLPLRLSCKESSTFSPSPSSSGSGDVTAPSRCSEPLRSKDGGPSKVSPNCAGWDRRDAIGDMTSATAARSSFAANSSAAIDRVQKELKELGLWKFAGGIMYIMQEVFGMPASRLIVPPNEQYGKFVLNEVLEAGNFGKHDERNRFGRSKLGHNLQRVYRDIRLSLIHI